MEKTVSDIFDTLEFVKKLGSGSFGEVSLYKDSKSDQNFAIKKIKAEYSEYGINKDFLLELYIVRNFSHPNLMRIDQFRVSQDYYEYLMPFYRTTLKDMIKAKYFSEAYNEEVIRRVAFQIIKGTEHLHKNRVMHRDLKPDNIMIPDKGKELIVLIDFGLSVNMKFPEYCYKSAKGRKISRDAFVYSIRGVLGFEGVH